MLMWAAMTKKPMAWSLPAETRQKDGKGKFAHEAVWKYLFTHPIDKTGAPVPIDPDCKVLK